MHLLKPGRRLRRMTPGFHEVINLSAENGIVQCALEPVTRDGLQNDPGIVVKSCLKTRSFLPGRFVGFALKFRNNLSTQ